MHLGVLHVRKNIFKADLQHKCEGVESLSCKQKVIMGYLAVIYAYNVLMVHLTSLGKWIKEVEQGDFGPYKHVMIP